jgi:hypothetical protein
MTGLDQNNPFDPPFVPWTFAEHDDAVREIAATGHKYAAKMGIRMGVACIDFADGTVIVLSPVIPVGETFTHSRKDENHVLAGFAPRHPHSIHEEGPDFTENLVEIKNPAAPIVVAPQWKAKQPDDNP